jgi:hypothetical protein
MCRLSMAWNSDLKKLQHSGHRTVKNGIVIRGIRSNSPYRFHAMQDAAIRCRLIVEENEIRGHGKHDGEPPQRDINDGDREEMPDGGA